MFGWLRKKISYPWSVYVVQGENDLIAVAFTDEPLTSLATIMFMYDKNGNPVDPYRICLNFNPTHTVVWIDETSFKDNGLNDSLMSEMSAADPEIFLRNPSSSRDVHLEFQEAKSKRKLDTTELFSLLWPDF